jgi:cardiolipin synthase
MFSLRARSKLLERGWSPRALLAFFADSGAERREQMRERAAEVRRMTLFGAVSAVALVAGLALVYLPRPGAGYAACALLSLAGVWLLTLWCRRYAGLLHAPDGGPPAAIGLANYLTLIRFYLIVPVVVLLAQDRLRTGLALYLALGLSDVVDGIVARRRGERTEFGIVMDPLADVLSTAAVFAVLYVRGFVPWWLFALLMLRYLMLVVGSFIFFLLVGPIRFRSTIPGKVVGVLQTAGVTAIVVALMAGPEWLERLGGWLFPFLGLCFASIVVSQAVIGIRERARLAAGERAASNGS